MYIYESEETIIRNYYGYCVISVVMYNNDGHCPIVNIWIYCDNV
jgi:hypothetical protein